MRVLVSWAAWMVAVAAGLVAVPLLWVADNVANEDGWVNFTAGFVEDAQLRDSTIAAVSDAALSRVTLPAELNRVVERAFQGVARTATEQPGFAQAWRESLRRTHRLNFAPDSTSTRLIADIGPLATFVVHDLSGDLPVRLTVPDQVLVPVYDQPDRNLIDGVIASPGRSKIGLGVAGVAALISMALAGGIAAALRRLGLAVLAVAALMLAATGLVLPGLLDRAPASSEFARQMRDLLVAHASDSLNGWATALLVVGAVVTVAGLASGLLRRLFSRP